MTDADKGVFWTLGAVLPALVLRAERSEMWLDAGQLTQEASDVCYMVGVMGDCMVAGYQASPRAAVSAAGFSSLGATGGGSDEPAPVDREFMGVRLAQGDRAEATVAARQVLVRNMSALPLVVGLLYVILDSVEGDRNGLRRRTDTVSCLLAEAVRFLRLFVHRNGGNQRALATHMDLLVALVRHRLAPAALIADVYRNNLALCRAVSPPDLAVFVGLLKDRPLDVDLLLPLFAVVRAEGVVLGANQAAIAGLLVDRASAGVLAPLRGRGVELMCSPDVGRRVAGAAEQLKLARLQAAILDDDFGGGGATLREAWDAADDAARSPAAVPAAAAGGFIRRLDLPDSPVVLGASSRRLYLELADDDSDGAVLRAAGDDSDGAVLLFAGRVLCLLAQCGLFHDYDVETKCQGILPLEDIVCALGNRDLPLPLRVGLMRVLREIWLDTQRPAMGLIGHDGLIDAVTAECGRIREYLGGGGGGGGGEPGVMLGRAYVFVELLPAVWYLHAVHALSERAELALPAARSAVREVAAWAAARGGGGGSGGGSGGGGGGGGGGGDGGMRGRIGGGSTGTMLALEAADGGPRRSPRPPDTVRALLASADGGHFNSYVEGVLRGALFAAAEGGVPRPLRAPVTRLGETTTGGGDVALLRSGATGEAGGGPHHAGVARYHALVTALREHLDEVHAEEYRVVVGALATNPSGAAAIDDVLSHLTAYARACGGRVIGRARAWWNGGRIRRVRIRMTRAMDACVWGMLSI